MIDVAPVYITGGVAVIGLAVFSRWKASYNWNWTSVGLATVAGVTWIVAGMERSNGIALDASVIMGLWLFYHLPRAFNRPPK
jgi:hypothetical protein